VTLHGIIPVYKPRGLTSHDVVSRIRRLVGQKRVGHTGTLDPEVDGVLPICLGQATRIVEYIQHLPKRYQGAMKIGISMDTEDQTGNIIKERVVDQLTAEQIIEVMSDFHGEIEQIPPMYSAVKVQGRRLYDLARAGKVIERPSRQVTIYHLELTYLESGVHPIVHFDVTCSKGTYIRTLCVDIGTAIGYPAHMTMLTRVESGPFQLVDCYSFDELESAKEAGNLANLIVGIDESLGHLPAMVVTEDDGQKVLDGIPFEWEENNNIPLIRIYTETGRFCAIYQLIQQELRPVKVFRDVD
jgi:tRNA pseudouridine55 synthase